MSKNQQDKLHPSAGDYSVGLGLLKASLYGGSELPIIRNFIRANLLNRSKTQILDIGSGDGQFLGRILKNNHLEYFGVHGVEPILENELEFRSIFPKGKFIGLPFQKFIFKQKYDLIISTHSIYYLEPVFFSLERILDALKPGGLAVVSLWTENCIFKKIVSSVTDARVLDSAHVEKDLKKIVEKKGFSLDSKIFRGPVASQSLLDLSDRQLEKVLSVIGRGLLQHSTNLDQVRRVVGAEPDSSARSVQVFGICRHQR